LTGGLSVQFRGEGWRLGGPVRFVGACEEIRADADRPDRLDSVLGRLDAIADSGETDLFAAGFLSYEAGVWLEGSRRSFRPPDLTPLALFGVFRLGSGVPLADGLVQGPEPRCGLGTSSLDRAGWAEAVGRIRAAIAAGDVYQVNLSRRVEAFGPVDADRLADAMWRENPVPFALHLRDGSLSIVCNSPELFLEAELESGTVRSGPIKGTASLAETGGAGALLLASEKDRAEHVMIVDLVRNDLGRVARAGGVSVPVLFGLKELRHLVHMESIVGARLRPGTRLSGLLRAAFPPGSVTGAPKRAALGFIRDLEPVPRGPYCGAAGWVSGSGQTVLNVAIRTAVVTPGVVRYHAGGGIVWDSDPSAEWSETAVKSVEFLRGIGVESNEG
jgi:para-aminobenzoate synthetase component 1